MSTSRAPSGRVAGVQMTHYGKLALLPRSHFAMTLKSDDFPTFGRPTMPIFKLFDGLPSLGFSTAAAFFGGILRLLCGVGEEEKKATKVWVGLTVQKSDEALVRLMQREMARPAMTIRRGVWAKAKGKSQSKPGCDADSQAALDWVGGSSFLIEPLLGVSDPKPRARPRRGRPGRPEPRRTDRE